MTTLMDQYDKAVKRTDIDDDPLQRQLLPHFQRIADALTPVKYWFFKPKRKQVAGLYLYGPVGGGKTFLVDLFFQYITEPQKQRLHFHQFMQQIDTQLRWLQGQKDPLRRIATHIAKSTRILCLDEFLVNDIADAMILAELLKALLTQGVVLVVSSNTPPDDLYRNGLQRARFLPAIELIKTHCDIVALSDNRDYRLGRAPSLQAYLYPINATNNQILAEQFHEIAEHILTSTELNVQQRMIPCVKLSEQVVWFKFNVICNLPRSQLDYIEIAERFKTVFVSEMKALTENDTARAILLINFIDVMYDKGVRLIVSAEVPVEQLYVRGEMQKDFQRTVSRLKEMQSEDYLRRHTRRELKFNMME